MPRYIALFFGRTKGAIGIDYRICTFTEGETESAARLALYDRYEHLHGLTLTPVVLRYVPTYINAQGLRTLMCAAQGRDTFATAAEAQAWIDAIYSNAYNAPHALSRIWGDNPRCEVRPCECWPAHFDPIGIYFD